MEMGRRQTGEPSCRLEEGCAEIPPPLPYADKVALVIFTDTLDQWEYLAGGFGGAMRYKLPTSAINDAAAALGYETPIPPHVMARIRILKKWLLEKDEKDRKNALPPGDTRSDEDREEMVN